MQYSFYILVYRGVLGYMQYSFYILVYRGVLGYMQYSFYVLVAFHKSGRKFKRCKLKVILPNEMRG